MSDCGETMSSAAACVVIQICMLLISQRSTSSHTEYKEYLERDRPHPNFRISV